MNPLSHSQPLRLMPAPPSGDRVAALFLSGDEPSASLEEICTWNLGSAEAELKLYVLPRSDTDRRPAGVLAVWPGDESAPVSARAQPYQVLLGRFYLPVNARLEPPVSDEELARLCRPEDTFVFHPGAGLCSFRSTDALSLADLLSAPAVSTQNWAGAHPGLTPNARLRSVRLEMPTDLESLFGEATREIGVDATRPEELPAAPGEAATGPVAEMNRKLQKWVASLALGFVGFLPRTASAPNLFNRLENWATQYLARLTGELNDMRHRELHRLLHLLEQDPNEGLRHALPLSGLSRRRGVAPPTGRLGQRDPNFRLGTLAGGKATDAWDVPPDLQTRLRERYRQLANEEARLGRHRRAAYIHAELLGDLPSAAACLKQGEHYHEAAVLYRDHLNRPLEAADCLAAGGEYAEAVTLYEQQKRFLQAAAMHHAMGDEASAHAAYRREVDRLTATDDLIAAAELLETKFAATDEAVMLLRQGWPGSKQAGRCLEKAFELLGASGAHPQAAGLIAGLGDETPAPTHMLSLVRQLATAQEHYPDEGVRHAARDLARVAVAGRLPAAGASEVRDLVDVLGRLAPQDRLLVRDGSRYLAERQAQEKRRAISSPLQEKMSSASVLSRRTVRKAGAFQMLEGARWQQFRSMGSYFFAAGYAPETRQMRVVRTTWDGFSQVAMWPNLAPEQTGNGMGPLLLEASREETGFVLCAFTALVSGTGPVLNPRRFPVADRPEWQRPVECGQPTWWPDAVLAATFAADGNLWLLRVVDDHQGFPDLPELLLSCHALHGGIVSQMPLLLPEPVLVALATESPEVYLVGLGNCLLVACGNHLLIRQGMSDWRELVFDARIIGLVPTPALARAGCAVRLENGVALVWLDQISSVQTVITNLPRPLAAFTRQGTLVVISREDRLGRLFEIVRGEARAAADFSGVGNQPVALLGTDERETFAIVDEDGPVHLYTG